MTNLSSCCGADLFPTDVLVWKCAKCFKVEFCDECGVPEGTISKLTPEQVAAIRWPDDNWGEFLNSDNIDFANYCLRYALDPLLSDNSLQDLMPEEVNGK